MIKIKSLLVVTSLHEFVAIAHRYGENIVTLWHLMHVR